MADAVPISDVLCEAIEYLSKFGSNLRVRSDNLKEKRIRKDKLRNTHAVQKAASKVLLICELSKKSIENVETGVKHILQQIDRTRDLTTSDSGNSSQRKSKVKNTVDYDYIVYDSSKLRIRKKVNMEHFTSVQVFARSMSISMQDKYPVFFDCKLYRSRNTYKTSRKLNNMSELVDNSFAGINNAIQKVNNEHSRDNTSEKSQNEQMECDLQNVNALPKCSKQPSEIRNDRLDNDLSVIDNETHESPKVNEISSPCDQSEPNLSENHTKLNITDDQSDKQTNSNISGNTENGMQNLQCNMSEKVQEIEGKKNFNEKPAQDEMVIENHLHSFSKTNCKDTKICRNKPSSKSKSSIKNKNVKAVINYSSESDDPQSLKVNTEKSDTKNSCETAESNDIDKIDTQELKDVIDVNNSKESLENTSEQRTHYPVNKQKSSTCDNSVESIDSGNEVIKIMDDSCKVKQINESKSDFACNNDLDQSDKNYENNLKSKSSENVISSKNSAKDSDTGSDNNTKPRLFLRCVSLDKLLKENVEKPKSKTCETRKYSVIRPKFSDKSKRKCYNGPKKLNTPNSKEDKNDLKVESEEEYWAEKRKEVEQFKPKNFIISVKRLPNLSEQYVLALNLKRITQNGLVICEVVSKLDKRYEKNAQKIGLPVDITCAKNALLYDSDSNKSKDLEDTPTKVKRMLLDESGSEKDEKSSSPGQNHSDSDKSKDLAYTPRKIKRALLNNSVLEKNKRCLSQNKKDSESKAKDSPSPGQSKSDKTKDVIDTPDNEVIRAPSNDSGSEKGESSMSPGSVTRVSQKESEKVEDHSLPGLNDSDNSKDLEDTPTKVKRALLNESESEQEENCPKLDPNSDEVSKLENANKIGSSDKEARNNKTPEPEQSTKVSDINNDLKSSLLCDSSDENHKLPSKKTTPTPSKRKHIMESMHAKKMLLTYSSSSDTEDEQLRNVLKDIRVCLLKEHSGDEINDKKEHEKPSSDSDNSFVKTKKRKFERSEDSSTDQKDLQRVVPEDFSSAKNSNIDENTEEKSNSSSQKMGRSKTGHSSSQTSDFQESHDKDIDGLTNLRTLNKRQRRRISTSTDRSQISSRKLRSKMPKVPHISEEGFLKAEDSSEEASLADSDVGEEVELPAVPLTSLNGDGFGHLAKDDLLGDSDSSTSENKSSQGVKEEGDTDEEEAVKSRRRKGHATISSDSEAGGSRKKDPNVKFSDFDDSENENSENGKRVKRKKHISESDGSGTSSTNEGKKKRRRIKNIDDSEGSGSETENEGRNKHGRKNIRKVMSKNQLEEATKKAAREEKERIARIAERQKLYNNLQFDESGKPDEVVLDKVILDFDPETKEPLIEVDKGLVKKLKPHQANGIKFMWDACFESVKRIKKDKGSGCILAHCMGLGKTLQVVSLTHTLLIHSDLTRVNRVLVVCPLSTVLNWVNEFKIWLKHAVTDFEVDIYELSRYKQNSERAWQLQQWYSNGGVCVLGYEMFRNLSADNVKKFKKKMLKSFQESLVDPGPDLVVCDEGHLLKNEKTSLSQAMNRVKTLRRIVLTGTPLQNNLKEYYCMVQFVKPNLLGKYNEYLNRFVNPITNGQYTDSTEHDIRIMKRRSHVLHKMLDGSVQRRDYGVLAPFLPPKLEFVLFITLTEVQIKLYQHYLDNYSRRPLAGKSSGFLFPDFQSLQRIWTHPLVLKYNSERYEIMQQKKREREEEDSEGSLVDFIDDDSTPDESSTEESSDSLSDMSDDSRKKSKKKKASKKGKNKSSTRRGTRANPVEAEEDVMAVENDGQAKAENPTEWWMSLVSEDELDDLRHSHKLVLLFDILRQCEAIGDKLLVFSQSLYSLDLIEHFLGKVDEATQEGRVDEKLNRHVGSWSPGVDYFRLDGSTSCENRSIWCKNFNREDNPRARLFLISTRAGGLGINLVAANRVIIFDVSWNPSHDVQSIFRVYRFGQKKPCYIYRFLAMGTMEEKIYERQVTKQAISKRVIDEQQIDRHYAENDLAELYKFEPQPPTPRELPPLPKDRLFAEMLKEYEAQIYKYHEHDSLLENKEEETLTEEERKAAWEDFENEKTRPPPVPFNAYNMHNGMVPGLLAQQQQQLAYAALAAMLRKDMPNINDDQIRNMLPLIYNSNPAMFGGYDYGLMQKMSEIYKYAQPGMMNPAMMNPVLNPAGGAGGNMGLGGSSGLQYEPPWQRQQQQQHQMQLQRLMQQQQNMGAKYYAGGLGSRDPVAMALQQQRAREMMLGERGRPRGRPPGAAPPPRARAPQPSGDVVNLDSD